MRIARKLLLLTIMALAAMALAATNASATNPITVVQEPSGALCNPCYVHATGEATLEAFHAFRVSTCEDEFLATLNAVGTGTIHHFINTDHAGMPCTRENCHAHAPEDEWPILSSEETGPNEGRMVVRFCLQTRSNTAQFVHCNANVHVAEEASGNHHYIFNVNQECNAAGTPVEVQGRWETEEVLGSSEGHAEQAIEILH
jgi:hypothetical protein